MFFSSLFGLIHYGKYSNDGIGSVACREIGICLTFLFPRGPSHRNFNSFEFCCWNYLDVLTGTPFKGMGNSKRRNHPQKDYFPYCRNFRSSLPYSLHFEQYLLLEKESFHFTPHQIQLIQHLWHIATLLFPVFSSSSSGI